MTGRLAMAWVAVCVLVCGCTMGSSSGDPSASPQPAGNPVVAQPMAGRSAPTPKPPPTTAPINIVDQGAVADGKTVNTAAIQKALNMCSARGGGVVIVPAGNFVTGSVVLGPRTTLQLEKDSILTGSPNIEDYPVIDVRWEGEWRPGHRSLLFANHVERIAIVGEGKIVGPPIALAGLRPRAGGTARGPSILEPIECRDVHFEGFSIQYQRMWNMHLTYCQDVLVKNVTIRSTMTNGDGIDVDSCKNVWIEGCDIQTGDDAIAIKSGRDTEAVNIGRPSEDVMIRNCRLSCPSYACVGIGTEMSGGVRNVRIENCQLRQSSNAFYIKGNVGRGGFIDNISAENIDVAQDVRTLLNFSLVRTGITGYEPVKGLAGIPHVTNISLNNIRTKAPTFVNGTTISPEKPVENVTLSNITGTSQRGINVANIKNLVLKNIDLTGFQGEFLQARNVTGPNIDKIKSPQDTTAK
ncbi:MAG TPA: glycosyl hydrolase family 28 protein [Tepidisphaeraceae bacterium]|nr:glycosyl hydrolase family 28 protein [Tepidisphaeraceae bacterium]